MDITLTNQQREQVANAILGSFDKDHLKAMLVLKLGYRIDFELDMSRGLRPIVIDLVNLASEGWLDKLLLSADAYREGQSSKLAAAIAMLGVTEPPVQPSATVLVQEPATDDNLEKIVNDRAPFLPFADFARRLTQIGPRICRIEYPANKARGTGWLVAPDLILTNYHVIEKIDKRIDSLTPVDILCRFDYDGVQPGSGQRTCGVAENWLLAARPYSQADLKANNGTAALDELDFALIRLSQPVGNDVLSTGGVRGWIEVEANAPVLQRNDFVVIPQHPQGRTLELAFGSALQYNQPANRVQYNVNTDPGSSGSPCFDITLKPFALHHAQGPTEKLNYNQAIPLRMIINYLKTQPVTPFWIN